MRSLILFLLTFFYSCSETNQQNIPKKVKGIPDSVFWAGGVDGGNWYLIDSFNKTRKEASIKVYDDAIGELLISKTFKMSCINEDGVNWNNLSEQFNAFDGEKIQLLIKGKDNSYRYCYFK